MKTSTEVTVLNDIESLKAKSEQEILSQVDGKVTVLCQSANEVALSPQSSQEDYESAKKLWRHIKDTSISVENKRKELKKPIIEFGKKLDAFAKSIYNPLKEAEAHVREQMKVYEDEQERLKEAKKAEKEALEKANEELTKRLMTLNNTLKRINECTTKQEVQKIQEELDKVNLKDFGDRSDEAGFIISNLKMTCNMIMPNLPDEYTIKEAEKVSENPEKAEEYLEKEGVDVDKVVNDGLHDINNMEYAGSKGGFGVFVGKDNKYYEPEKKELETSSQQGELDFSAVADVNSQSNHESQSEVHQDNEVSYFDSDTVHNELQNSVLPMAVFEGTDENNVTQILTVDSMSKSDNEIGLPNQISIRILNSDGTENVGVYNLEKIN